MQQKRVVLNHGLYFAGFKGSYVSAIEGQGWGDYFTLIDKQENSIAEPTSGEAMGVIGNGKFVIQVGGVYHVLNESGEEAFANLVAEDSEQQMLDSVGEFHDGLDEVRAHSESGHVDIIIVDIEGNVLFRLDKTVVYEIKEVGLKYE